MAPAPLRFPPSRPILLAVEPQLFVSDIAASCDYFVGKLSFEIVFIHGEPAFYAQVRRDNLSLNFRHAESPVFDAGFRQREEDALAATITVDDIKALYEEFLATEVIFHRHLERQFWGADMFIVSDPDDNLIGFVG